MPKGQKTRNAGVKCPPGERELRLVQCAEFLYEHPNCTWTQFINHFMKEFDILKNTANIYWNDAQKKLAEIATEELSSDRKRAVVRLLRLLEKEETIKGKLEIAKEINKIQGLHSTKVDVTTDGDKIEPIDIKSLVSFSKPDKDESES